MNLTAEHLRIASRIDAKMQKFVCDGNDDITILAEMFDVLQRVLPGCFAAPGRGRPSGIYLAERPAAFAVVGMAAFFTAVVRASVTVIILVTEMTGSFTLLLPMLLACFAAMTVPALLGDPPIYDSLTRYAVSRLKLSMPISSKQGSS